ncbi:hypothetical protein RI054_09g48620 [Pseudoscourfieldia marina]
MTKLSRNSDYAFAVRTRIQEPRRPDDDNAIIIPDIIRRTNERASLHDRIIRANPENRRRRLALPVQGRGGGRNGGRTGGRGGRNTERFDPQRHNRRCQNANCRLHTLTTLRCVMRLAARVTTQHVGAATPTQAAEVAVDEADIKVAEADEEDDTRCSTLHSRSITRHSNTKTSNNLEYLPPPPPLPSQLMQNNIARVGEAFPTMNAPPPTGQMYQSWPISTFQCILFGELGGFVSILSYIVMRDAGAVLVDKKTDPYILLPNSDIMFLKEMDSGHLYTELTSLTNVDEAYPTRLSTQGNGTHDWDICTHAALKIFPRREQIPAMRVSSLPCTSPNALAANRRNQSPSTR